MLAPRRGILKNSNIGNWGIQDKEGMLSSPEWWGGYMTMDRLTSMGGGGWQVWDSVWGIPRELQMRFFAAEGGFLAGGAH